jgi:hypothetical protein
MFLSAFNICFEIQNVHSSKKHITSYRDGFPLLKLQLSIKHGFVRMYRQEEFEDTKGVIRIRKSKKNKQHNGQNKKDKTTINDLQNIHFISIDLLQSMLSRDRLVLLTSQ